jgi:hypothetical protein
LKRRKTWAWRKFDAISCVTLMCVVFSAFM